MGLLKPVLYIDGQQADLYDDESISINFTVKSVTEIDKVFSEYSRPFTIPASKTNNRILEHFYNTSVTTSFNPNTIIEANLEINRLPFKKGVVRLEGAKIENGKVVNYRLVFYGSVSGLKSKFANDKLWELDLSALTVEFNGTNDIIDSVVDRIHSGDVLTPMISQTRLLKLSGIASDVNDIRETTLYTTDLKPAVRVKKILDAIETKYGITFTSTFFDAADFQNIYMWANRFQGRTKQWEIPWQEFVEQTANTVDPDGYWDAANNYFNVSSSTGTTTNTFTLNILLDDSANGLILDSEIEYEICAYDEAAEQILQTKQASGDATIEFEIDRPGSGDPNQNIQFFFRSGEPANFNITIQFLTTTVNNGSGSDYSMENFHFTNETYTSLGATYTAEGNLPDMSVNEFLGALIKMFNLTIVSTSPTEFTVEPLDDYYAAGSTLNLSQYVDFLNYDVNTRDVAGKVSFLFEQDDGVVNENFREEIQGTPLSYGDLETTLVDSNGDLISSSELTIKPGLMNHLWERQILANGTVTNLMTAQGLDADGRPTSERPYLFYYVQQQSLTTDERFNLSLRYSQSGTNRLTYNVCYNFNTLDDSYTKSLNYGVERNPWTFNDGTSTSPTLYSEYWEDYITDIYNTKARRFDLKAVLPVGIIISLQLNDTIVIGNQRFIVDSADIDITTGKSRLSLLNVIE